MISDHSMYTNTSVGSKDNSVGQVSMNDLLDQMSGKMEFFTLKIGIDCIFYYNHIDELLQCSIMPLISTFVGGYVNGAHDALNLVECGGAREQGFAQQHLPQDAA